MKGVFAFVCYDRFGRVAWAQRAHNLWTTEGRNDLLNQYFGGTALTAVYVGLISSVSYSAITAGDTAAQIVGNASGTNGWAEACNGTYLPTISQTSRPATTFGAASGASIVATGLANFTFTSSGTVKGAFLISDNTLGGQTGKLLAVALFDQGDQVVSNAQTLAHTYTLSL